MMDVTLSPEAVVQRQFEAYNARDVAAWVATYAPNAIHYQIHGELIAQGHEQLAQRIALRFNEPDLHATLLSRMVMDSIVIDHERIRRNFPEGRGSIEMLCVYEVADGLIQKASFALGTPVLED